MSKAGNKTKKRMSSVVGECTCIIASVLQIHKKLIRYLTAFNLRDSQGRLLEFQFTKHTILTLSTQTSNATTGNVMVVRLPES